MQSAVQWYFGIVRKIKVLWPNFEGPDADEVEYNIMRLLEALTGGKLERLGETLGCLGG